MTLDAEVRTLLLAANRGDLIVEIRSPKRESNVVKIRHVTVYSEEQHLITNHKRTVLTYRVIDIRVSLVWLLQLSIKLSVTPNFGSTPNDLIFISKYEFPCIHISLWTYLRL